MAGGGCCGCCGAFRPRYKKLVDNIFPPNPEDGLVKSNMEKLVWYAMHSPDKLDRIGEYFAHRLYRDVHRRRTGYVVIAMDALDQLLVACHANNLNLFVESFLQVTQKLLESQESTLQIRAVQSFEKYANIREDTPQYHRKYDFFVDKFTAMCYCNQSDVQVRQKLRISGIMGLQGVIRKTDYDDLGDNIWRPSHMDKIVPALLYNMEEKLNGSQEQRIDDDSADHRSDENKQPFQLAEICLRELVSRATAGKINIVIKPLLFHFDHHNLWPSTTFAVHTFKILMFSIQVQYSVSVIKMLISHLTQKSNTSSKIRIGIADVLSQVIHIAAGECIGPSVIDIINSMLEQIRSSIVDERRSKNPQEAVDENIYQDTLIHALGEYYNHLPDYQKKESMTFILDKVPGSDRQDDVDKPRPAREVKLQHLLLKSLLKVSTKYTTVQYSTTFSPTFLVRLMRMSVSHDTEIRLTVQKILHTLIDRHDNVTKFNKSTIEFSKLKLVAEKASRQDINFWKKNGMELLLSVQENCEFNNNTVESIESIYKTLILLLTEIRHDDGLLDILRVLFNIQSYAIDFENALSVTRRIQLHALVAAVMVAVGHCIPPIKEHIRKVVDKRSVEAPHLLPALLPHYGHPTPVIENLQPEFLFDNDVVVQILKNANLDERRLTSSMNSIQRRTSTFKHAPGGSASDVNVEVNSADSSPGIPKKTIGEEVTFEALKKAFLESPDHDRKEEEERRKQIRNDFINEPYEVLIAKMEQPDVLQTKLNDIFNRILPSFSNSNTQPTHVTNLEMTDVSPHMMFPHDPYLI